MRDGGRVRRAALAYLARPWPEMTKGMEEDRETAVAFAAVAYCLDEHIEKYKHLTELLTAARARITVALCSRRDMNAVIAAAKRSVETVTPNAKGGAA